MADQIELQTAEKILITRFCQEAPHSAANRLETLSVEGAVKILNDVPDEIAAQVWSALSPYLAAEMIDLLPDATTLAMLSHIDPGRAASILAIVNTDKKDTLLAGLESTLTREISELMAYPMDSAGALMDTRVLLFSAEMTVADAQQILRARKYDLPVYELRIVDESQRLVSVVQLNKLALASPDQTLESIAGRVAVVVEPTASREEISEIMEEHRLEELTVVDFAGRIMGVIRHTTLIDVLKQDVSIDIQTMVGVSKDEQAFSSSFLAIRRRLPWMQINLLTAFAAAAVVGLFESTIAKFTALAVLLPVVAGQSGNAGAQALAITMRGLALREVRIRDWPKLVRKESVVGLWNGAAIAIVCGIAVYIWSGQVGLVLVIASSMILAMMVAGIAGVLVPIGLKRIGQDPAVASSIVLTTITDIAGFFSFLGIATLLSGLLS